MTNFVKTTVNGGGITSNCLKHLTMSAAEKVKNIQSFGLETEDLMNSK